MLDSKIPVEAELTLLRKQVFKIKRRGAERYRCPLATPSKIDLLQEQESVRAWIYNLSISGAGLNINQPLEVNAEVLLHLRRAGRTARIELPARVIHATQELDGSWRVGCEFHQALKTEVLDDLLD